MFDKVLRKKSFSFVCNKSNGASVIINDFLLSYFISRFPIKTVNQVCQETLDKDLLTITTSIVLNIYSDENLKLRYLNYKFSKIRKVLS